MTALTVVLVLLAVLLALAAVALVATGPRHRGTLGVTYTHLRRTAAENRRHHRVMDDLQTIADRHRT